MKIMDPWVENPSLDKSRLVRIAEAICRGRSSAMSDFRPEAGDDRWSLGCLAYRRTCHQILELSKTENWLRILPETEALRFTFAMDQTPIRFYVGDPDDIPTRYKGRSPAEARQMELSLQIGGRPVRDEVLRLAVVKGPNGEVADVVLAQHDDEGRPVWGYYIPIDQSTSTSNVVLMQKDPAVLPAPMVVPITEPETTKNNETDKIARTGQAPLR
jgi:hypothetical protein